MTNYTFNPKTEEIPFQLESGMMFEIVFGGCTTLYILSQVDYHRLLLFSIGHTSNRLSQTYVNSTWTAAEFDGYLRESGVSSWKLVKDITIEYTV